MKVSSFGLAVFGGEIYTGYFLIGNSKHDGVPGNILLLVCVQKEFISEMKLLVPASDCFLQVSDPVCLFFKCRSGQNDGLCAVDDLETIFHVRSIGQVNDCHFIQWQHVLWDLFLATAAGPLNNQ